MADIVKELRDDLRRMQLERDHARYTCETLKQQAKRLRTELRRERAEHRLTKMARDMLMAARPQDTP